VGCPCKGPKTKCKAMPSPPKKQLKEKGEPHPDKEGRLAELECQNGEGEGSKVGKNKHQKGLSAASTKSRGKDPIKAKEEGL